MEAAGVMKPQGLTVDGISPALTSISRNLQLLSISQLLRMRKTYLFPGLGPSSVHRHQAIFPKKVISSLSRASTHFGQLLYC